MSQHSRTYLLTDVAKKSHTMTVNRCAVEDPITRHVGTILCVLERYVRTRLRRDSTVSRVACIYEKRIS